MYAVQSRSFINGKESCNRGILKFIAQPTKTDLIVDLLAREGTHIEEGWVKDIPMGRLGHPSELQGAIVWMASDASSYLNGSDIVSGIYSHTV